MELTRKRELDGDDNDEPSSLARAITPPPTKRQRRTTGDDQIKIIESPWHLTWIRDLPDSSNKGAVTVQDILGDPLISECWNFNFLHDLDFLMRAFDPDTRHLVKLHVIHGFWKREDSNRLMLEQQASSFENVQLHAAYMPEMFGTHHSKMLILLRHDDTAQVVIHTANMIAKDWTNMTNGVWKSPLLPKLTTDEASVEGDETSQDGPVGSGARFKHDLMQYLGHYDERRVVCRPLIQQLKDYDFSSVRAALVASVPGKHDHLDTSRTSWGWSALKRYLKHVPCSPEASEVVVQISSIATLGAKDDWLKKTLFQSLAASASPPSRPDFKVVFPTADDIRVSLDGYASGGSIHTKIQSSQQAKQLQYLRPLFHRWGNNASSDETKQSGRTRAAPHIKTYIRYNNQGSIDWALLTSANLSKQAWGEAANAGGQVRIASWEIGVLIWPELIAGKDSVMVGTYGTNIPTPAKNNEPTVGLRLPYDNPLKKYTADEVPWVPTMVHSQPDWLGTTWGLS